MSEMNEQHDTCLYEYSYIYWFSTTTMVFTYRVVKQSGCMGDMGAGSGREQWAAVPTDGRNIAPGVHNIDLQGWRPGL